MALIKKQVFLRSKDENLQQFLAKEQGKMPLNEKSSGDKVNLVSEAAFKKRYQEGKKAYDAKKAKQWPKDKPDPSGRDYPGELEDREYQKAFEVDPEGGARQYDKKADDARNERLYRRTMKYLKDEFPDQGSDNSNTADDRTQKEYDPTARKTGAGDKSGFRASPEGGARKKIEAQDYKDWQREQAASGKSKATIGDNVDPATIVTKAIQDAWFEKAKGKQEKLNRRAGLRATREKIDTDAMSPSQKAAFNKKADANMREANKNDPGLMYSAPQNVTSQDNRRYRSEIAAANTKKAIQGELIDMNSIQQGIYDAWLEKRGPVDKLTGGRVKLETNPDKQANPQKPFLGVPGVELQTKLKRGGLGAKLHGAIGGKETTPSQKQRMTEGKAKAAGLDYAAKGWFSEAIMEALLEKADATDADAAKGFGKIREDLKRKAAAEEQAAKDYKASKYSKTDDDFDETGGWPDDWKGEENPPRPKGQ